MAKRESQGRSSPNRSTEAVRRGQAELLADLERIRAMTPPRKPGVTYLTARELIREGLDIKRDQVSRDG
jgi:hypothetical protein